jgi:TadE-like protein
MTISLRRRLTADVQGATTLEFALASLVFFMTVFGTIEFGRAVWQYNMMSDLAQEGARWAAVHGPGNGSACASGTQAACKASVSQIQDYVRSRAPGSFTITVTTESPLGTTAAPSGLPVGAPIVVRVSSSFTPVTGIIPNSTIPLTAFAQMTMQR